MSDTQSLDGLTLEELQAGLKALNLARMSGSLSVRYSDGTSVTYRSEAELARQAAYVSGRIATLTATAVAVDPISRPIRAYICRPWNGFR